MWIRNWEDERRAVWLKHVNMSGEEEKVGRRNCHRGQITPALVGQGEEFGSHCVTAKHPDGHEDWHSRHSGSQAPQSCPLLLLPQELNHQGRVGAPRAREQARRRPLCSGHRAPSWGGALSSGLCCSLLSTTGHTSHLSPAPWVLSESLAEGPLTETPVGQTNLWLEPRQDPWLPGLWCCSTAWYLHPPWPLRRTCWLR